MMLVVKDLRVRQVVSCQLHSENPRKLPNLAKNELLSKMNLVSSFAVSYTLDTQWVALHLGASLDFGKIIIVLCCTACILNTTLYICVLMFTSQCCPITGKLFFAYIVSHIQFQTVIFFFSLAVQIWYAQCDHFETTVNSGSSKQAVGWVRLCF